MRILYVDDHIETTFSMATLLSEFGHIADTATSIQVAKRLCESNQYDLLMVDLALPDGDGLEMLKSNCIKERPRGIIVSARGTNREIQAARDAGFVHLVKPITAGQIQHILAGFDAEGATKWVSVQEFKAN